ncbi:hypothetical protein [Synechococcus sp. WH 8109]|uniref:hypothetical protein n=1 Tax=Synechococcus sp. WH 8109 TaxID=166314 RepID=UPI001E38308B|nr:hypothetical protein [Synechococcus sp. WH 8109]
MVRENLNTANNVLANSAPRLAQELLSWSIQTLIAAAGQAMQQKNPGALVACIRQLDHMTGTGYNYHRGYGINTHAETKITGSPEVFRF